MKNRKILNVLPTETVQQLIKRLVILRKQDIKNKENIKYYVREFPEEKSIDSEGRNVESNNYAVSNESLGNAIDISNHESDDTFDVLNTRAYSKMCAEIEKFLSIPFLAKLDIDKTKLRPQSREAVSSRLKKYIATANYQMKAIREMCGEVDEYQNTSLIHSIRALNFIESQYSNDGVTQDGMDNLLDSLFDLIVKREKDALFYRKRHPNTRVLHKCQDESILAEIKQIKWALQCSPYQLAYREIDTPKGLIHGTSRY